MLTNGLPAPLNISRVAGIEEVYSFYVLNDDGAERDMRYYTFEGSAVADDGTSYELTAVCNGQPINKVDISIPALPLGTYRYSLVASDDTGEKEPFVAGVIGAQYPDLPAPFEPCDCPNRAIVVKLPGGGKKAQALWSRGTEMENALRQIGDIVPLLLSVKDFVESFDEALRQAVQVVNNYLWIGGVNTGHYLKGEDGYTPRIGNDGNWYIGDTLVGKATGDDGITPHITSDGYWAFGSLKTNVRAAGKDGINGSAMRRVVIDSVIDLPQEEERGVYYYVRQGDGTFEVYVWLENEGWASIGPANDVAALNLATDSVHGMVKFSAGEQTDGAPVGWRKGDDATAIVPLAGTAVAGTGKISTSSIVSEGANIGFNSSKQLQVVKATTGLRGSVKLSTSDVVDDGGFIGESASGQMRVKQAAAFTWGVVKVGTSVPQSMGMPWIIPVGKAAEGIRNEHGQDITGQLFNNLLVGGALRTAMKNTWLDWSPSGVNVNLLPDNSNAVGIMTSNQFSQSADNGLELLPATSSRMAGVYLALNADDERENAVPSMATVSGVFAAKAEVYTKEQCDSKFLTAAKADELYVKPDSTVFVKSGYGNTTIIHKMTRAAFEALGTRDANAIYLVKR